ncbi:MAG: cadherin-like beta sandwich domain-containing protein [Lactobacillales bacterium]|jgi:hypothetical protein|nr:cadherin-like beta sandwich domain-containing protein [Lactobacillales bacterium]
MKLGKNFLKKAMLIGMTGVLLTPNIGNVKVFADEMVSAFDSSEEVKAYLIELYGQAEGEALFNQLRESGVINDRGQFRIVKISYKDQDYTLEQIKEILAQPETVLTDEAFIDGEKVQLKDIKAMIEIEALLAKKESDLAFAPDSETIENLKSLIQQFSQNGITLQYGTNLMNDREAVANGYKSRSTTLKQDTVKSVVELSSTGENAKLILTSDSAFPYETVFSYSIEDGSWSAAVADKDRTGTVTMAAGDTAAEIPIQVSKLKQPGESGYDATVDKYNGKKYVKVNLRNESGVSLPEGETGQFAVSMANNFSYDNLLARLDGKNLYRADNTEIVNSSVSVMKQGDTSFGNNALTVHWEIPAFEKISTIQNAKFGASILLDEDDQTIYEEGLMSGIAVRPIELKMSDAVSFPNVNGYFDGITSNNVFKGDYFNDNSFVGGAEVSKTEIDQWDVGYKAGSSLLFNYVVAKGFNADMLAQHYVDVTQTMSYIQTPAKVTNISIPDKKFKAGDFVPVTVTYDLPILSTGSKIIMSDGAECPTMATADKKSEASYTKVVDYNYKVPETAASEVAVKEVRAIPYIVTKGNPNNRAIENITINENVSGTVKTSANGERSTFQGIVLKNDAGAEITDNTYGQSDSTAHIEIPLGAPSKNGIQWVYDSQNQDSGNLKNYKASIDGGKTLIDLKINEGTTEETASLTGEVTLPENLTQENKIKRVELYWWNPAINDWAVMLNGDSFYTDFKIAGVNLLSADEMRIIPPTNWATPGVITNPTGDTFKFGYEIDNASTASDKSVTWSTDKPEIATIDQEGVIHLGTEPGKVNVILKANNKGLNNDVQKTYELQVTTATTPDLIIPSAVSEFLVTKGDDAQIYWSTNIPYLNQHGGPFGLSKKDETQFTVKLYKGNFTDSQLEGKTPAKTYAGEKLINVSQFTIPSGDLGEISEKNKPNYTFQVSVSDPYDDDVTVTAVGHIIVKSKPASVTVSAPIKETILDTVGSVNFNFEVKNFDEVNAKDGDISYTVTKAGEDIIESSTTDTTGSVLIPIQDVPNIKLKETYQINFQVKNGTDEAYSFASQTFEVYSHDALDILVDNKKGDNVVISNREWLKGLTSEEIIDLGRDINLNRAISINYGDYAWSRLNDQIKWLSENNEYATINYEQGGLYNNIETLSYETYSPGTDFKVQGRKDTPEPVKITATHAALTGMTTDVNVSVETAKDRLYIFQAVPATTTTVTYKNGAGDQVEKTTDDQGRLAVYEEKGIASDVQFKSGTGANAFMATITAKTLKSGEASTVSLGLYPLNTVTLVNVANVVYYLKKPDGRPLANQDVIVNGGTYKNGEYCVKSQLPTDSVMTTDSSGKLTISVDATNFTISGDAEPLAALDEIETVVELQFKDGDTYPYFPIIAKSSGKTNAKNSVTTGEHIEYVRENTNAGQVAKTYIADQKYYDAGATGAYDLIGYKGLIGVNKNHPDRIVDTTVVWWDATGFTENAKVESNSSVGKALKGQSYKTTTYPFSTIHITEQSQPLNKTTLDGWLEDFAQDTMIYKLYEDGAALNNTLATGFSVSNALNTPNVLDQDGGSRDIFKELKSSLSGSNNGSQYNNDSTNKDILLKGGMALLEGLSSKGELNGGVFQMQIMATQDPLAFEAVITLGIDEVENDANLMEEAPTNIDGGYGDLTLLPQVTDVASMIKSGAKGWGKDQMKELQDNYAAPSETPIGDKIVNFRAQGMFTAQIRYNVGTRKWETRVAEGGMQLGMELGYKWNVNKFPGTFEVGLGAGLMVDFNSKSIYEERTYNGIKESWSEEAKKHDYQNIYLTQLRINAWAKVFAGFGFDYTVLAAKVGVFGKVILTSNNAWLSRSYLGEQDPGALLTKKTENGQHIRLSGAFGVEVVLKFLFISYTNVIASQQYSHDWSFNNWKKIVDYWGEVHGGSYPATQATAAQMKALYFNDHPEVMKMYAAIPAIESRDYLEEGTRAWKTRLGAANGIASAFETNAYPFSNPQLLDDGSQFVYLSDNESEDVTETRASFAKLNGASYTDQGNIENSGTSYGDADLKVSGNNSLAVASWVAITDKSIADRGEGTTVTAEEQASIAKSAEINASIWNGAKWTTTQLTVNSVPDVAPVVASNANKAVVVWRNTYIDDVSDVRSLSTNDNLVYKIYDKATAKWSEQKPLYNGTNGTITGLDIALSADDKLGIAYTVKEADEDQADGVQIDRPVYNMIVDTKNEAVVKNQLLTASGLNESPRIKTVKVDGKEVFLTAWYNSINGTEETSAESDILLKLVSKAGIIENDAHNFPETLSQAADGKKFDVSNDFEFAKTTGNTLNDLALTWTSFEATGDESEETAGILNSVKFVMKKDGLISITGVNKVAILPTSTVADTFDAYLAGGTTLQTVILGTKNLADTTSVETDDGVVAVPKRQSSLFSATSTFVANAEISSLVANPDEVVRGTELPVEFSLANTGISTIDKVEITVGADKKTYNAASVQPNETKQFLLNYNIPADATIANPAYNVKVTFANGETKDLTGTVNIAVLNVGLSRVKQLKAADGHRELAVNVYNSSEVKLSQLANPSVKLGFYYDQESKYAVKEVTLTGEDLNLIDEGGFTQNVNINIKELLETLKLNEVPESGIPVYVKAEIYDGETAVSELHTEDNSQIYTIQSLAKNIDAEHVESEVNLANVDGHAVADVTLQNLVMAEASNLNAKVDLYNASGALIETRYLAADGDLVDLASEATAKRQVEFSQTGDHLRVTLFTSVADDLNNNLALLKLEGASAQEIAAFDPATTDYTWHLTNSFSGVIQAIAQSSNASVKILDVAGNEYRVGEQLPLNFTSKDGASTDLENKFRIVVTPKDPTGNAKTYNLTIVNDLVQTPGEVLLGIPEANHNGWINSLTSTPAVSILADKMGEDFETASVHIVINGTQYDFDSNTATQALEEDGVYNTSTFATSTTGRNSAAVNANFKVDRTAPEFDGEMTLTKTNDDLLSSDLLEGGFLRAFGLSKTINILGAGQIFSDKQVEVRVKVNDNLSGMDTVVLSTPDGDEYPMTLDGDEYVATITKAMRGAITITATDIAGNVSTLDNDGNIIKQVSAPSIELATADVTDNSLTLTGAIAFDDADLFKSAVIEYRKVGNTSWKTLKDLDADEAKSFSLAVKGLTSETEYEFRASVANLSNDDVATYAIRAKTAKTAVAADLPKTNDAKGTLPVTGGADAKATKVVALGNFGEVRTDLVAFITIAGSTALLVVFVYRRRKISE